MKRCLSAVLLFCLLCSIALASDKVHADTDILFRGIPWGTSMEDVKAALIADGLPEGRITYDYTVKDVDGKYATDNAGIMYDIQESDLDKTGGLFVAGHRIAELTVKAIYGIVSDGISTDAADSKFYTATYYFEVPAGEEEANGLFDDLKQKMIAIYGEPGINDSIISEKCIGWYGIDYHTMAVLYYYPGKMPLMYIEYWNNMVVEDIKALQTIMYTGDLSSSDGL